MNVGSALSVIVAALAILGAGGSAWAFLADRGNKDRLQGLRDDVSDRNERIDFLEGENTRKDGVITAQAEEIREMHGEIRSLKEYRDAQAGPLAAMLELITAQREQIASLHSLLEAHNAIAQSGFATLETQGADQLRILGDRRHVPMEGITREVGGADG